MSRRKRIIHPHVKEYFTFNRRERRGFLVLCFLLIVQISLNYYLHYWKKAPGPLPGPELHEMALAWQQEVLFSEKRDDDSPANAGSAEHVPPQLFLFDPNTASETDWEKLGLNSKQIHTIRNFIEKGGRFRKKNDLRKIYGLKESECARLEPYIVIPGGDAKHEGKSFQRSFQKTELHIDLAKADTLELDRLPGIGPAYARRIFRYRELLGGWVSCSQLLEVWGFTDSLYEKIQPHIFLSDTIPFRKIAVNSWSADSMAHHPYMDRRVARVIVNYREQHGAFARVEDLQAVPLVTDEMFRKLAPYITVSENSLH